jgi:hypothetical protein
MRNTGSYNQKGGGLRKIRSLSVWGRAMRCAKCGAESTGRKLCAACGGPLAIRCPSCDAENAAASAFCEECGTALTGHSASVAISSPQAAAIVFPSPDTPEQPGDSATLEGERKIVTALFVDLKGSTQLMENLDPEVAHAIVAPALRIYG